MQGWECQKCAHKHDEIRFSCINCKEPLKGKVSNVRIVSREEGIKEFIDNNKPKTRIRNPILDEIPECFIRSNED